jgi:outer membrane biosynthesis protein TonB
MIEILLQAERALSMGMIDQAERMYRQAADADPRNSIAVVGLARVALERGDDPAAWRFAQAALLIDGENVAAQRLAGRLEEVWAYRGESLPDVARTEAAAAGATPADTEDDDAAQPGTPGPAVPVPEPAPVVEPEAASEPGSAFELVPGLAPAPDPAPAPEAPGPETAPGPAAEPEPSHDPHTEPEPVPAPPPHLGVVDRLFRRNRA